MAGNSSPQGSDSARLDTTATAAPTVTIAEDINNNGFISAAELAGQVDVRITLPAGSAAGDTLTVTDGNMVRTFTLTAAQVGAGHGKARCVERLMQTLIARTVFAQPMHHGDRTERFPVSRQGTPPQDETIGGGKQRVAHGAVPVSGSGRTLHQHARKGAEHRPD
jgi:hypothetical protein